MVDSSGRVLQAAEFASRWLDDSGSPILKGRCIEMKSQETRSLIVRSRLGSEGLIFATGADAESLNQARLEKYSYGPMHKTCDQSISTNLLSLALPVSFEDHVANGYTIKAVATLNGKEKQRWDFINAGPAAPILDLAALSNGRYALQFELAPLFSEGGVPQSFSCDLVVDRKAPQISLLGTDGGLLTGKSIEVRPNGRIAWQNLNKTSDEVLQYCFISAESTADECANPSISSDPLVMPESGSWRLLYRGADAANNLSDWAALDIEVIDEAKLTDIRNKLELAQSYQKLGLTQYVALQLLEGMESYQALNTENERKRIKQELDMAVFRHQLDTRDSFTFRWNEKEAVDYIGSMSPKDGAAVHAFMRTIDFNNKGLNFISDGKALLPEITVNPTHMLAACSVKDLMSYKDGSQFKIFDGKNITVLPIDGDRFQYTLTMQFSQDCRYLLFSHSWEEFYVYDLQTKQIVPFLPENFPSLPSGIHMRCDHAFALGEGSDTRYYAYCRRNDLNPWKLYAVNAAGETLTGFKNAAGETKPFPDVLSKQPLQLMTLENFLFFIAADNTFAIFDRNFSAISPKVNGAKEELIFDRVRQRVLAAEFSWGVPGAEPSRYYETYAVESKEGNPPTLKGTYQQFAVEGKGPRIGNDLIVSQPAFSSSSFASELLVSRFDAPAYTYYGQRPLERDRLLFLDSQDNALMRSTGNLYREISPNESLFRRSIRISISEQNFIPVNLGTKTVMFTTPDGTRQNMYMSEFDNSTPFSSVLRTPRTQVAKAIDTDVDWLMYPYGAQALLVQVAKDRTQFQWRDDADKEVITVAKIARPGNIVATGDADLFWFIGYRAESQVTGELDLYSVRVSTGETNLVESFHAATEPHLAVKRQAPTIELDRFGNTLYLIYPDLVLKTRFSGPWDRPVFNAAEKKIFSPDLKSLLPTPDFKKWIGITAEKIDVYDANWQSIDTLKASDIYAKQQGFVGGGVMLDADTYQSGLSRISLSKKTKVDVGFASKPLTNVLTKDAAFDSQGRLRFATFGEWYSLPLDLTENQAHLCRYLSGLGVHLYPELRDRFKQTACGKK